MARFPREATPFESFSARWGGLFQVRPPWLLLTLGLGIGALAMSQLILDPELESIQLIEVGVPLALTLPILYVAFHVRESPRSGQFQMHALTLAVPFALIAGSTVTLVLWSQAYQGVRLADPLFPLVVSLGAGSGVGSVSGMLLHDLTLTKGELAEEVQRARSLNQRLKVVNRVLRHNVRNSMTVAMAALEQLKSEIEERHLHRLIETCRDSLNRLHDTAEKTLHIERLEAGTTEREALDVVSVVEGKLETAREQYSDVETSAHLPEEASVMGHPLLDIAITETIENAIVHNDCVDPIVDVSIEARQGRVILRVADNGPGIPEDQIEVLQRAEETPLDHVSGVGLWLVKWVVDASDATIEFYESDLEGQTVEMTFERP